MLIARGYPFFLLCFSAGGECGKGRKVSTFAAHAIGNMQGHKGSIATCSEQGKLHVDIEGVIQHFEQFIAINSDGGSQMTEAARK